MRTSAVTEGATLTGRGGRLGNPVIDVIGRSFTGPFRLNACRLEISFGVMFRVVAGCFVGPFTVGPEIFGVSLG